MKPSQGRRTWVKLWITDWLEGTTRYQMTDAQRAFWIDILAMAGRSRFGGIVCSGKDGEELIGYPLSKFQGLLAEPLDVEATFELFQRTGKITMQVSGEGSRKLYVVFITNWARYQTEYDRTKKYRKAAATPNATHLLHPKSQPCYGKGNTTEVAVEVEVEKEGVVVQEGAPTDDRLFSPTGKKWKKLGIGKISERYRVFIELADKIKPRLDETIGSWCGRILDACATADVAYPPQFLAITRRYREHDEPCFSMEQRIKEEQRLRGLA